MSSKCCPDWLAKLLLIGAFGIAVAVAFMTL